MSLSPSYAGPPLLVRGGEWAGVAFCRYSLHTGISNLFEKDTRQHISALCSPCIRLFLTHQGDGSISDSQGCLIPWVDSVVSHPTPTSTPFPQAPRHGYSVMFSPALLKELKVVDNLLGVFVLF
jgi:hypothetical protein